MDAGHRRVNRVGYGGVWPAGAARWRGWLRVEAVGLELGDGEAAGGGEPAEEGSWAGEADGGDDGPPCHYYWRGVHGVVCGVWCVEGRRGRVLDFRRQLGVSSV